MVLGVVCGGGGRCDQFSSVVGGGGGGGGGSISISIPQSSFNTGYFSLTFLLFLVGSGLVVVVVVVGWSPPRFLAGDITNPFSKLISSLTSCALLISVLPFSQTLTDFSS